MHIVHTQVGGRIRGRGRGRGAQGEGHSERGHAKQCDCLPQEQVEGEEGVGGVVTKEEDSTLDRSSSKGGSRNTEVPEYFSVCVHVCVCVCGVVKLGPVCVKNCC